LLGSPAEPAYQDSYNYDCGYDFGNIHHIGNIYITGARGALREKAQKPEKVVYRQAGFPGPLVYRYKDKSYCNANEECAEYEGDGAL